MDNFKHFSLMYLNDWYWWDKPFSERISSSDKDDSLDAFHSAAKYYKVTRNFEDDGNEKRLQAALDLVLSVGGPLTEDNVCQQVSALADAFERRYGKNAVSAASKFLWLRHRSPVVIFDSRAVAWLRANNYKVPHGSGYHEYRRQWLAAYADNEERIRVACSGLPSVKDYTMASEWTSDEVAAIAGSRWFQERVFDKYLWFNAASR
ncbi:hypothetical protein [Azonexus fungiphilus]|nr:hypothetical protein [Azonexus fungiphilus]